MILLLLHLLHLQLADRFLILLLSHFNHVVLVSLAGASLHVVMLQEQLPKLLLVDLDHVGVAVFAFLAFDKVAFFVVLGLFIAYHLVTLDQLLLVAVMLLVVRVLFYVLLNLIAVFLDTLHVAVLALVHFFITL